MGKRFVDWSIGSIVGNIAWGALCAIGLFFFNERTGCVYIVLDSMRGHELELAGWTMAFALSGALIGLIIRHRIAISQLAAKDAECEQRIAEVLEPLPDVSRLTQTQARYVINCWENMTSEGGIGIFREPNDPVASILVEDGVLRVFPDSPNSLGWVLYVLTPKWFEYVTAHEREVREAAGGGWT